MKIVFIGGGTGLSCLARHAAELLKENPSEFSQLTVIQHPYDDGGHSGEIVREHGVFGPGDFRKSILALSSPWMNAQRYEELNKRTGTVSQGNLVMLSGMLKHGSKSPGKGLLEGIRVLSEACNLREEFQVLPISLDPAVLTAHLANGKTIVGQANIARHFDHENEKITSVKLVPAAGMPHPKLYRKAEKAILAADKIVASSGSFWTSTWPNTLPEGSKETLSETKAKIFMTVNLVTQHSESHRWNSGEFVEKLFTAAGRSFEAILYNDWEAEVRSLREKLLRGDESVQPVIEALGKDFFPVVYTRPGSSTLSATGFLKRSEKIVLDRFAEWSGSAFQHNKHTVRRILDL